MGTFKPKEGYVHVSRGSPESNDRLELLYRVFKENPYGIIRIEVCRKYKIPAASFEAYLNRIESEKGEPVGMDDSGGFFLIRERAKYLKELQEASAKRLQIQKELGWGNSQ